MVKTFNILGHIWLVVRVNLEIMLFPNVSLKKNSVCLCSDWKWYPCFDTMWKKFLTNNVTFCYIFFNNKIKFKPSHSDIYVTNEHWTDVDEMN